MTDQSLTELSLYPENRGCTAPTTARILDIPTAVYSSDPQVKCR